MLANHLESPVCVRSCYLAIQIELVELTLNVRRVVFETKPNLANVFVRRGSNVHAVIAASEISFAIKSINDAFSEFNDWLGECTAPLKLQIGHR